MYVNTVSSKKWSIIKLDLLDFVLPPVMIVNALTYQYTYEAPHTLTQEYSWDPANNNKGTSVLKKMTLPTFPLLLKHSTQMPLMMTIMILHKSLDIYSNACLLPSPSLITTDYSPFSLSCLTLKAMSNRSCSSLVWEALRPVATEALGLRPAYMTCLRSWCLVWLRSVSMRGCV